MGNEYHQKVNRNIAKYGFQDPSQSEGLASELYDPENNGDDCDGVCWIHGEFVSTSLGRKAHRRQVWRLCIRTRGMSQGSLNIVPTPQ